jgi:hypothetical protein
MAAQSTVGKRLRFFWPLTSPLPPQVTQKLGFPHFSVPAMKAPVGHVRASSTHKRISALTSVGIQPLKRALLFFLLRVPKSDMQQCPNFQLSRELGTLLRLDFGTGKSVSSSRTGHASNWELGTPQSPTKSSSQSVPNSLAV